MFEYRPHALFVTFQGVQAETRQIHVFSDYTSYCATRIICAPQPNLDAARRAFHSFSYATAKLPAETRARLKAAHKARGRH